ncbi:MAG: serine hydrolase domain-containing protein [Candidatus Limnocylindrales bacterium]
MDRPARMRRKRASMDPGRISRTALLGLLCLVVAACDLAAGSPAVSPSPPPGAPGAVPTAVVTATPFPTVEPTVVPSVEPIAPSPSIGAIAAGPELAEDRAFDEATQKALQKVLDAARKRIPAPGISVAIRTADGRVWTGTSGARQLSPRRPVTDATVFSIASITKTFVTAVVLQLVDEGRLSLDDRLSEFLPDFRDARKITIRQLLQHRSGVFNYFESARYARQAFRDPNRQWTTREILRFVESPYCRPGTCFHYSNTNFVLLGEVVEAVTGRAISEEIRARLLDPLDLEHTSYQPDERTPANGAHGHLWGGGTTFYDQTEGDRWLPHMSAASIAGASGAMVANASDLARWAMALYGSDEVLPEDLREAMTQYRPRDRYGLGTRMRIFSGRRGFGHGGSLRGYEDQVWYFPREGVSIALLSNRGLYNPDKTVRQLLRELWKHLDEPAPQYDPSRNTSG